MNDPQIIDERYSRQQDIIPPDRLGRSKATVVGVGAIGRQVALQLTAMGIRWLQLIDFDVVEESNLASQGYLEADLGTLKVKATADLCHSMNRPLEVIAVPHRFRRSMDVGNILFCCVDRIEARRLIWQAVSDRVDFFADGRMTAEVLRLVVAYDSASRAHYPTTLFPTEQAYQGSCTARTTIYCANVAAGLMLAQFSKWLRRFPIEPDITFNLLTCELACLARCR